MSIFKACDIRGVYGKDFSESDFYRLGVGLALLMEGADRICVGGDLRESTLVLKAHLIAGLVERSKHVVDVGQAPTPAVYFAKSGLEADACAIVTASHNPPEYNGLKFMIGDLPVGDGDVEYLRSVSEQIVGFPAKPGRSEEVEIIPAYVDFLADSARELNLRSHTVVCDPGGGAATLVLPKLLPHLCPNRFPMLNGKPDPLFRCRPPDSSRSENLQLLKERVVQEKADLGVGFDGDGDRAAFVDDEGQVLTADEVAVILLWTLSDKVRDRNVVLDQKLSRVVHQTVQKMGGIPLLERSGHSYIKRKVIQSKAVLGAEISGHYFFPDLGGGDDGAYAMLRMMNALATLKKPLSQLRREVPPRFVTPEIRIPCDADLARAIMDRLEKTFADETVVRLDGIRVETAFGWFLFRASITEPKVTLRFEGCDEQCLGELIRRFARVVPEMKAGLAETPLEMGDVQSPTGL